MADENEFIVGEYVDNVEVKAQKIIRLSVAVQLAMCAPQLPPAGRVARRQLSPLFSATHDRAFSSRSVCVDKSHA
jgi:hypothetical protein